MSDIKITDLNPSETIEIILHHNNPLKYTHAGKNEYRWILTKARGSHSPEEITHFSGMLISNNIREKLVSVYGGPYAAKGLSSQFCSRGVLKEAPAEIPWQYIGQMWVLRRKEIDVISEKHQRLTTERLKVLI